MPIKGISEIRRLPRLGKIRLGIKKKNAEGKEYPTSVDYFVCPDEVQKIYGEKPRELDIVFPLSEIEAIFPQYYKMYGHSTGLKCKGDGEKASCINQETGGFDEIECLGKDCPNYQDGDCKERATLNFILPKVKLDGVYQLDTSSFHSIVKINSSLDYIKSMFGKIDMLPFKLIMEDQEIHPNKKMKKTIKTLRIAFDAKKVMQSIQKREGLLDQAGNKQIEAPKPGQVIHQTEAPKIQLPSSDDGQADEQTFVEDEDIKVPPVEDPKTTDENESKAKRVPPKKQGKTFKQVSASDEEEISLCDVCENALSNKELASCKGGFKEKGELKYKFLCGVCQQECGFIKK